MRTVRTNWPISGLRRLSIAQQAAVRPHRPAVLRHRHDKIYNLMGHAADVGAYEDRRMGHKGGDIGTRVGSGESRSADPAIRVSR
jgi:hypothetical protein